MHTCMHKQHALCKRWRLSPTSNICIEIWTALLCRRMLRRSNALELSLSWADESYQIMHDTYICQEPPTGTACSCNGWILCVQCKGCGWNASASMYSWSLICFLSGEAQVQIEHLWMLNASIENLHLVQMCDLHTFQLAILNDHARGQAISKKVCSNYMLLVHACMTWKGSVHACIHAWIMHVWSLNAACAWAPGTMLKSEAEVFNA